MSGYTPELKELIKKVEATRPQRVERARKNQHFQALTMEQRKEWLNKYHIGGVFILRRNVKSETEARKFIKDLREKIAGPSGLPIFIAADQEGGPIWVFPFLQELTGQRDIKNNIGYSERTHAVIEPRLSLQWFLKMDKLGAMAKQAVKSKKVRIQPKNFEKTYGSITSKRTRRSTLAPAVAAIMRTALMVFPPLPIILPT